MKKRNDLLDSKDVAWILDMSPSDVIELASSGKLKASKVGRFWRFRPRDVRAYKWTQEKEQIATPLSPFG
jgi:hypothetical protein